MLDCGTIAASFKSQFASVPGSPHSAFKPSASAALKIGSDERQASRPLSQETETLKDLRKLDPQVLSEIHQSFYSDLYRYAQYRVSDPAVAEDITSETFLRLIDAVHNGRAPDSSIRGWLFGTTANLVNDHFRRVYREEEIMEEAATEPSFQQTRKPLKRIEQQDYLGIAFKKLTEEQQHVIALRFGSELSIKETSNVMGKNENAVKALQYRAIRSLRRELEEEV